MSTRRQCVTKLEQISQLSVRQRSVLKEVTDKIPFRCNDYYLSLIDWDDPDDPIRRIVIPDIQELDEWGSLDPSNEQAYTVMPGLEHKYNSTVLLLVSNTCDGICRYCFRKRFFMDSQDYCLGDLPAALGYIREHNEITNVLLTGGDPLARATSEIENIVSGLREIDHVSVIRIGTKLPAFNPYRIIDDPSLLEMIAKYSDGRKTIYIMVHFVHPRELTDAAVESLCLLRKAGAVIANQAPLIRGVNDSPEVLAELLESLSHIGVAPYYLFQCRPALSNKAYTVPIEEGYKIFGEAMSKVSGLAKRTRFVMSHSSGKMEILGMTKNAIYFRYHRAACDEDSGRLMAFRRNPDACWFDNYDEAEQQRGAPSSLKKLKRKGILPVFDYFGK